jgi:hypothetical protein
MDASSATKLTFQRLDNGLTEQTGTVRDMSRTVHYAAKLDNSAVAGALTRRP